MSRLILTVARGKEKYARMGMALGRSLSLIEDQTPRAVITDVDDVDWARYFHHVIRPPNPRSALDKVLGLQLTEATQILALDCDCLAFRRLDDVFEAAAGNAFAIQGFPQSEGKWHGAEVAEICRRYNRTSIPRFNGGLLYYERQDEAERMFRRAFEIEKDYGKTGFVDFRGNASEEVCLSLAMMETGVGTMLGDELDFMSTGVGMIGRPRVDILRGQCEFVCRRQEVRFIRPYVFHASRYVNFMFYWKQVRALEALEK